MNIFLIEDEPPILRDISAIIKSFPEDYHIIGTAADGEKALTFLQEHGDEIDLIISDIQIPVINGLDLIKIVSETMPHILCIILTGYGRFEYAQRALQYGVFDYLLKPIVEEELHTQLGKAYARKFIDSLYEGPAAGRSTVAHPNRDTAAMPVSYQIALLCVGPFPIQPAMLDIQPAALLSQPELCAYLKAHMPSGSDYWIINGKSLSEKIILFSIPPDFPLKSRQYIRTLFTPLLSADQTMTIVAHSQVQGIHSVGNAAALLRSFLSRHITLGKSQLLFYSTDTTAENPEEYAELHTLHHGLADLFGTKKIYLFKAELKNYVNHLRRRKPTQYQLTALLYELFSSCLSAANIQSPDIYASVSDVIMLSETYDALSLNLASIFDAYFEVLLKEKEPFGSSTEVLMKIDLYIRESYTGPISTSQIAEQFGFTPAYLSKKFREYKEITISDYITNLRMEKAKELLSSGTAHKIKDVAAYVGYDDSLYFSKVFKKATGCSPRQYLDAYL